MMLRTRSIGYVGCLLIGLTVLARAGDESPNKLLDEAQAAFAKGDRAKALALAGKAIETDPDSVVAYRVRGVMWERLNEHQRAIADFDKAIELDPASAELYDRRGSEHFKLGHIDQSIADFDKAIELAPELEPGHWKRGISYYYAGQYDLGRKQFEGYQTVDDNDVENAVWRYLCMARSDGVAEARGALLRIKNDTRLPMMQVYALYGGQAEPDDVLAAARAGDPAPEELNQRLFYAHLYLGLYSEAAGDHQQARQRISEAADKHRIGHYMWDVARVHADRLENPSGRTGNQPTRIVLIGHGPDHPYRTHCYLPDCELLARCLRQTPGVEAIVSRGWPEEAELLDGAAAIVLHVKHGGDLLFDPVRRDQALRLLKQGVGLTAIHWGTGCTPDEKQDHWLEALGGHFHNSFARVLVETTTLRRGAPEHAVCRGWNDFELRDELYIKLRFMPQALPVAGANVAGDDYPIAWAYERPESSGGRSFGFVAGHFHDNFGIDPFRRLVVNGILWTARLDVPADGAPCDISAEDLELSEEFEKLKP